jgi:hypothetical protein
MASADAGGDLLAGWVQGGRIRVGGFDRPPGPPVLLGPRGWQGRPRPRLAFSAATDPFGASYLLEVDGRAAGRTTGRSLRPSRGLHGGRHSWRVVAVDRRGQRRASAAGRLLIDLRAPALALAVAGSAVRLRVRDSGGSGLLGVSVRWGDGSASSGPAARHAYARPGSYTVLARAEDRAGNSRALRRVVRVP